MSQARATRTVVVTNEEGIHVRAADLIAKLVRRFDSKVFLMKDRRRVEGTDVLQILSLVTLPGERVVLEAAGQDAQQAVDALAQLFADNFHKDNVKTEEQT